MNKISFFTPITNHPSSIFTFSENYFNFGTTTAKFLHTVNEANYVERETTPWTYTSMAATALKVALVFTLLLPLTAALFAVKISYRLQHHFTLETDTSPHKVLKQKESELTAANAGLPQLNTKIRNLENELRYQRNKFSLLEQAAQLYKQQAASLSHQHKSEVEQLNKRFIQLYRVLKSKTNELEKTKKELESVKRSSEPQRSPPIDEAACEDDSPSSSPPPTPLDITEAFVLVENSATPFENKLREYISKNCPGFSFQQASEKIKAGHEFFRSILENPDKVLEASKKLSENEQKKEIGSLVWFWMAHAINKDQPFHEGTFITDFHPQELYQFLLKYPNVYRRQQSHLKERVPQRGFGYGIDFAEGPAQKKHLLFEIIDEGTRLFIKPENYGVQTWSDTFFHSLEFLESLTRHAGLGSNQAEGMRKERVNPDWIRDFEKFICSEKERVLNDAKSLGLTYIRNYLDAYQVALKAFLNQLEIDPTNLSSFASLVPESLEKSVILSKAEKEGLPYIRAYLSPILDQVDEVLKNLPIPTYEGQTGHEVHLGDSMALDPSLLGLNS